MDDRLTEQPLFTCRQCSGFDGADVLKASCASGCNPHCHFLFLLQSISFDHSILLDFLISTETCFLEYFVRFLKFLRTECQGFTAVCVQTGTLVFHLQKLLGSSCADDMSVGPFTEPTRVFSTLEMKSSSTRPCLVEYGSSDESDHENMDSQHEHRALICEKSKFSGLCMKEDVRGPLPIRQYHFGSSYSSGLQIQPTSSLERPDGLSVLVLQNMQTSCSNMATLSGHVTCEASARAVGCLSELREVVTRLHTWEETSLSFLRQRSLLRSLL